MSAPLSASMIIAGIEGLLVRQRAAKGLTQPELASRLRVSLSTFKRWESGTAEPTLRESIRWMRALDIMPTFGVTAEGVSSDTSDARPAGDAPASSASIPHRALFASSFSEDVAGGRSLHGNSAGGDFPNAEAAR